MLEKLTHDLLDEMKKAGLAQHPAFEAVTWLHHDLLAKARPDELLLAHVYTGGKAKHYVDMAAARKHFARWCRNNPDMRPSMSRNSKVVEGKRQDHPCLKYVAGKLGLPTYIVAKAWSRKKLTK